MINSKEIGTKNVSKETLYIAIFIALVAGFLGGIIFSAFKTASPTSSQPTASRQASEKESVSPEETAQILALEKEVALHPQNLEALIELGHRYFDTAQPQKAIKMYTRALEIDPANGDVWTDLGVMYRRSGQPAKAVESFDQAIKVNPKHETARFNKGIVLMYDLNDTQGAIKSWQDLLAVNPNAVAPNGMPLSDLIKEAQNTGK